MISSREQVQKAQKILTEILDLLDEDRLSRKIDEPIETIVRDFLKEPLGPFSLSVFHQVISEFVQQVHERGVLFRQRLPPEESCAEAISIIKNSYQNPHTVGYKAALLDAKNEGLDGLQLVVTHMAEAIKAGERGKYTQWVLESRLIPLDWETKFQITQLLLNRLRPFLPPYLLRRSPSLLVEILPSLIQMELTTEAQLRQILTDKSEIQGP